MNNYTGLAYSGNVCVKLKIANKIITITNHNEGTEYLFKAFAKFLTGNSNGDIDTPQYLDLRYKENSSDYWKTWLSKQISLSGREYSYSDEFSNWVAKFSAVINHSNLIQSITEDLDDDGQFQLVLYTGTDEDNDLPNDLAYLDVKAKDLARILPGTQAIIEWSMAVTNITV